MDEINEASNKNSFQDLNLTAASAGKRQFVSAVQGRLKVRSPGQVNLMLHKLAINQMDLEEGKFALKIPVKRWSEIGAVLWKERRDIILKTKEKRNHKTL